MDDGSATPPASSARARARARAAAWAAIYPAPLLGVWWLLFTWQLGPAPTGALESWETGLTGWIPGTPFVALPFAVVAALQWCGPLLSTVGGALVLWRLRHDGPRVPAALALLAALAILAFVVSTWASVGYQWHIDDASGRQSFSANHSPGPCCGVWNLALAGWCGWAAIRYGPTFRQDG